jgi:transcriptional regulator with XRE-family HTH domain
MYSLSDRLKFALSRPPGYTQAGLARACGIATPSVSDWLSGKTKRIEGENLLRAAKFLNVSPWWLATGEGEAELKDSKEVNLPKGMARFASILNDRSDEEIECIAQALELLINLKHKKDTAHYRHMLVDRSDLPDIKIHRSQKKAG